MGRDIGKLHPELQNIVNNLTSKCKAAGLPLLITETFRIKAEQDTLYEQGRTKPGSIVTNVKYPNSAHCWGVAVDFARNVKGREYDDSDGFFKKVGEIGESLGLEWGGRWTSFMDKPHLQMKKYMPGNSTKTLVNTYGTPDSFIRTWSNGANSGSKKEENAGGGNASDGEKKGEDKDMEELKKLKEQISELQNQLNGLANIMTRIDREMDPVKVKYGYVDGNMPEWARDTVQKLKEKESVKTNDPGKVLRGNDAGNLQLNDELLRIFVVLDRAGSFER